MTTSTLNATTPKEIRCGDVFSLPPKLNRAGRQLRAAVWDLKPGALVELRSLDEPTTEAVEVHLVSVVALVSMAKIVEDNPTGRLLWKAMKEARD